MPVGNRYLYVGVLTEHGLYAVKAHCTFDLKKFPALTTSLHQEASDAGMGRGDAPPCNRTLINDGLHRGK